MQAPDPRGRRPLRLAQHRVLPADQHVPDDRAVPCTPDGGEAEQSAPAKGRDERGPVVGGVAVDTAFSIVAQFQAEYRGVAEYYKLAFNRHRLGRLHYVMERSLTKTLARKYRITVPQVYRRFRAVLDTEHGPRRGLQVTVDRGGGKSHW